MEVTRLAITPERWKKGTLPQTHCPFLGIGGEPDSIPAAIAADPTLGGLVQWCVPVSVSSYGLVQWAGVGHMGARLQVQAGGM